MRLAALGLGLLLVTPAWAAGGKAEAKKSAQAAKREFDLGHFQEAIALYEAAYTAHPVPALFFNIGQCHRQLGQDERAVYFFKRYLESGPPAGQAKATEALVVELEASLASRQARAQEEAAAAERLRLEQARLATAQATAAAAEERRKAEVAAAAAAAAAARRPAVERALLAPRPEVQAEVPVTKRWWFWTAIGVAVAAGVGAGVYAGTAPRPTPTTFPDINAR